VQFSILAQRGNTRCQQPHAPCCTLGLPFEIDESVLQEVARAAEGRLFFEKSRAADWKDALLEEPIGPQLRVVPSSNRIAVLMTSLLDGLSDLSSLR
jgi:hypothetical protein